MRAELQALSLSPIPTSQPHTSIPTLNLSAELALNRDKICKLIPTSQTRPSQVSTICTPWWSTTLFRDAKSLTIWNLSSNLLHLLIYALFAIGFTRFSINSKTLFFRFKRFWRLFRCSKAWKFCWIFWSSILVRGIQQMLRKKHI